MLFAKCTYSDKGFSNFILTITFSGSHTKKHLLLPCATHLCFGCTSINSKPMSVSMPLPTTRTTTRVFPVQKTRLLWLWYFGAQDHRCTSKTSCPQCPLFKSTFRQGILWNISTLWAPLRIRLSPTSFRLGFRMLIKADPGLWGWQNRRADDTSLPRHLLYLVT